MVKGVISESNSLIGSRFEDEVGNFVRALTNGNYVVASPDWSNGTVYGAGAVTFGSGVTGITGTVSNSNSLVGSTFLDQVGSYVVPLSNGNYLVPSPTWDNANIVDAGAATVGSGTTGIVGVVSAANSLVGSSANDSVGNGGACALANGNVVVSSPYWNNLGIVDAGAGTFINSANPAVGAISANNSLVGSHTEDLVGYCTALTNGNYVIPTYQWDNGATVDVGAATFGRGDIGVKGVISSANSLIGSSASDFVSRGGVTPLTNGNYVIDSFLWKNGTQAAAGAATFGSGTSGITGVISSANSLVGDAENDSVGQDSIALKSGNYVVTSGRWRFGVPSSPVKGAATFGSGVTGISGVVSISNSLVGDSNAQTNIFFDILTFSNGNYGVRSANFSSGFSGFTVGSGQTGVVGAVSSANSLTGYSSQGPLAYTLTELANGNYLVWSPKWDNGPNLGAGAFTLGLSDGSTIGPLDASNSVLGVNANTWPYTPHPVYDPARNQLIVGQASLNKVILHRPGSATQTIIQSESPDPSNEAEPVVFVAHVISTSNPTVGQVTFNASSGESCTARRPTQISASTASFTCSIVFTRNGRFDVWAEYTGSFKHAYSRSENESHGSNINSVFANGFEGDKP